MPSDHRRWFNSQAYADTLLRIHCHPFNPGAQSVDVTINSCGLCGPEPAAQPLVTGNQKPDDTDSPEHDSSSSGSGPGSKQGGKTPQPVSTYHAHALILREQSAYFDASLGELWPHQQQQPRKHKQEQGATPSSAPGAPSTLDLYLDPGQEDAMDLMLRFMYDHPLPAVTPDTTPLLFQCLHMADRFDVPQCVSAILSTLKDLQSIAVSAVVLRCVGHVSPGISGRPDFQAILLSAKRCVIDACGNALVVVRSDQLRKDFCALPFMAVLAWAESDELQVQSENCVVYLLSSWVQAAQEVGGQGVSADQLEQLAQQVRVLHLGPAYQYRIMPQLGWFQSCSCSVQMPRLLTLRHAAGSDAFPADEVELAEFLDELRKFPTQWVAKARQRRNVTDAEQLLRWEVGGEQLRQLYEGSTVYSPPLYLNGFMFRMIADTDAYQDAADGIQTLGLYAGVDPVQADGAIPWPKTAPISVGRVDFKLLHGPEGGVSCMMACSPWVGTFSVGLGAMLKKRMPSASDLIAPYLKDGKLHVEVRFTTVDQH